MGDMAFASNEMEISPCGMNMMSQETKAKEAGCDACKIAESVWSQDLVSPNTEIILQGGEKVAMPIFERVEVLGLSDLIINKSYIPPDKITVWNSHLISQQGIVLVV